MNIVELFIENKLKDLSDKEIYVTACHAYFTNKVHVQRPTKLVFKPRKSSEAIADRLKEKLDKITILLNKSKRLNLKYDDLYLYLKDNLSELSYKEFCYIEKELINLYAMIPYKYPDTPSKILKDSRCEIGYRLQNYTKKTNVEVEKNHLELFNSLEEAQDFFNEKREETKSDLNKFLEEEIVKLKETFNTIMEEL